MKGNQKRRGKRTHPPPQPIRLIFHMFLSSFCSFVWGILAVGIMAKIQLYVYFFFSLKHDFLKQICGLNYIGDILFLLFKNWSKSRDTWVARSVKRLVLGFSSGHDLTVCGFRPYIRLCSEDTEPAWDSLSLSLSLCPSPTLLPAPSLSK